MPDLPIAFAEDTVRIAAQGAFPSQVHVFDEDSTRALQAAHAARRPLLVRGEPGTGKTQLAHAAAAALKLPCVSATVDAGTEARDLLYGFDAVARLGLAQVLGSLNGMTEATLLKRLDESKFISPGALWWGFDWRSAEAAFQRGDRSARTPYSVPVGWTADEPVVVLIDEVDKADSDVPNGLLEALGRGEFRVPGVGGIVAVNSDVPPLVVVTTNEERALPDAFLRRCLVLTLELPRDGEALVRLLIERGRAHFPDLQLEAVQKAAEMLETDRRQMRNLGMSPPGQAEFLDLLRVVDQLRDGPGDPLRLLEELRRFTFQKHPEGSGA
ncbi:MAG: MoxR family ATPase [Planctomycetota bacterium]